MSKRYGSDASFSGLPAHWASRTRSQHRFSHLSHVHIPRAFECTTVRSRYKRQLIRLNMKKKWPTRTGMEDSRPLFFCKRFSYNENALYHMNSQSCAPGVLHNPTVHRVSRGAFKQTKFNQTFILNATVWDDGRLNSTSTRSPRVSIGRT